MSATLSRRDFLRAGALAGAGLTLAVYLPGCGVSPVAEVSTPFKPNAWVRLRTDGSVLLVVDRSEMGQGVLTALPMLLAEELDAPWESIRIEPAPAGREYLNPDFGIQATGGSSSVHAAWVPLREAGARARQLLIAAAAGAWGVAPGECSTEPGVVVHPATQRRLKYGELAERAALLPVPERVTLKDPKDYRYIGHPMPRLDAPDKVRGLAQFGMDVEVPNALVAVIARCPVFGGSAASWNEAAARQVPGVRHVVRISSGVAVVADGYWAARKGRDALSVVWIEGPHSGLSSTAIAAQLEQLGSRPGLLARNEGTPLRSGREVSATYFAPYQAHACMEPMNATAHVEATRCTVWAPTQFQLGTAFGLPGAQEQVARLSGLAPEQVTIHTTLLGGGFGRRFVNDFIGEAVETSKAVQAPVRVIWSREDDIQHDYYRPVARARFAARLGDDGLPTSFTCDVACASIMAGLGVPASQLDTSSVEALQNLPYDIPNVRVTAANGIFPVPLGFWRSVGSSQNGFMLECFMDELALAAGEDPVQYRRVLLSKKPRHLGVLELAAAQAGWGSPLPAGRARGVAVVESFNSYVAEVAEVSLRADRTIKVERVVAAVDCGTVVNPDIVKAQIESAVVYGLSATLHGEITIERGRVVQSNFHDYPLLRMREMPVVEVHLVPSSEPPTGIGEPGTPPIAAAVANAVYALTQQRLRSLPIRSVPA